jgi:hypothetical protein
VKAACVADVQRGEYWAVSKVTFAEYAPRWVAGYTGRTRRGIGPRTLAMYRDDLGLDGNGDPTARGRSRSSAGHLCRRSAPVT